MPDEAVDVYLRGPHGVVERMGVTPQDGPEAVEQCVRAMFGVPRGAPVTVRDPAGRHVPLSGPGLISRAQRGGAGNEAAPLVVGIVEPPPADGGGAGLMLPTLPFADGGAAGRQHSGGVAGRQHSGGAAGRQHSGGAAARGGSGRGRRASAYASSLSGGLASPTMPRQVSMKAPADAPEEDLESAAEEARFWRELASCTVKRVRRQHTSVLEPSGTLAGAAEAEGAMAAASPPFFGSMASLQLSGLAPYGEAEGREDEEDRQAYWRALRFDTSTYLIDRVFKEWSGDDGVLTFGELRYALRDEEKGPRLQLTDAQLVQAIRLVKVRLRRDGETPTNAELSASTSVRKHAATASDRPGVTDDNLDDDIQDQPPVDRLTFASVWQRLMLGAVCGREGAPQKRIRLMQYCPRWVKELELTEDQFFFRSRRGGAGKGVAHWARIDAAERRVVERAGVKFFLHPLANEDMLTAGEEGRTKVDRYHRQYFVSLEVYALSECRSAASGRRDVLYTHDEWVKNGLGQAAWEEAQRPQPHHADVGRRVTRSHLFLVATGRPPEEGEREEFGHRDWLLSIVADLSGSEDPLDRFHSSGAAAETLLDRVWQSLENHGRQREFQADFLMYTIIDTAAGEMEKLCSQYGQRLRWLHANLGGTQRHQEERAQEVSTVRLELQELRQWVRQVIGIVRHLVSDCKGSGGQGKREDAWRFGAWAAGTGRSLQLYLNDTSDCLERSQDRLMMLADLARSAAEQGERQQDSAMNQTLSVLAIMTAVFCPAQFICGVYGMNFVDGEGNPGMPELTWRYGYLYFWMLVVGLVIAGLIVVYIFLLGRPLGGQLCRPAS